ncbi:unannotated protein [freshwater metagenome]|uniref:Unannotated protein n=1 Tax=freshwater metagenome TaxID=449393 RepID=A0A6J6EE79_9ZZZZ
MRPPVVELDSKTVTSIGVVDSASKVSAVVNPEIPPPTMATRPG